jgi:preprotein translocase subunit SecA
VTSSAELAVPQSAEYKPFYEMFKFTSSHNKKEPLEKKDAYKVDILYGAVEDYQADVLRDEYSKLGTRSNRPFDVVIVDEVDSMFIDGKTSMVRLSSPMPGMNELEPILAAIWLQIDLVASRIIEDADGNAYFVEDPENPQNSYFKLETTKLEFMKQNVEDHMRMLLRDVERIPDEQKKLLSDYPSMEVPKHLRSFVLSNRLELYIANAIYAKFSCTKGKDYIIRDKKIKIVDVSNTGVVQENMTWSDGLHQFLQFKHGAALGSEQMSTNYIAITTFFLRYGKNIYGLSGTLGCDDSKKFLKETYDVDLAVVPPFKQEQHKVLTPKVLQMEEKWRREIVSSLMSKVRNGRACLVISDSIKEAEQLGEILIKEFKYPEAKVLMYKTEKDSEVVNKKIGSGEIILSTNIAGRGTDIKLTDDVNEKGGLHLCMTFLPENTRVERQNLGECQFNLLSVDSTKF